MRRTIAIAGLLAALGALGCGKSNDAAGAPPTKTPPPTTTAIPGHDAVAEDTSPKNAPRLMPAETYVRSYLAIFGGLSPIASQAALQGNGAGALFDTWDDYLSSLGFPDYRVDLPRGAQTNALMLATYERIGIALCDRAVEKDLMGTPPPIEQRIVFAFDAPATGLDQAGFATRFDVLHRTILAYPAALAPTERTARFFQLYQDTVAHHGDKSVKSSFSPALVGWAVVCQGLIRHPEFHLY